MWNKLWHWGPPVILLLFGLEKLSEGIYLCQKTEFIIKAIKARHLSRTIAKCVCQCTLNNAKGPFSLGLIIQLKATELDSMEGKTTFFSLFQFFFFLLSHTDISSPLMVNTVWSYLSNCEISLPEEWGEGGAWGGKEAVLSNISLAIFYLDWLIKIKERWKMLLKASCQ